MTEPPCPCITSSHCWDSASKIAILFQAKYYEQVHGVANMSMEEFETKAIKTGPNPPSLWLHYVDGTFVIPKAEHSHQFLQHISSIDPHTQLTSETHSINISMPILHTLVSLGLDNSLLTTVYRKSTQIDQYLHLDSHHKLSAKCSLFITLIHRARTVCFIPQLLHKDEEHIKGVLQRCNYPTWAINKLKINQKYNTTQVQNNTSNNNHSKIHVVVSYTMGLSNSFKNKNPPGGPKEQG